MGIVKVYSQLICLGFKPKEMLLAQGKKRLVVYFNTAGFEATKELLFSFHCDIVTPIATNYICDGAHDSRRFNFDDVSKFGCITAQQFGSYKFAPEDFVIVLSDMQHIGIWSILSNSNIKHFTLTQFICNAVSWQLTIKPLIELQERHGAKIVLLKHTVSPHNLKRELTDSEQIIKDRKYTFVDILQKKVNTNCFRGFEYDTPEGIQEILTPPTSYFNGQGVKVFNDFSSRWVNCENGVRVTCYHNENALLNVFFVGACGCLGYGAQDSGTYASVLQKLCNDRFPGKVNVHNYGCFCEEQFMHLAKKISSLPIECGDVVVCAGNIALLHDSAYNYPQMNWLLFSTDFLSEKHNYGEVFIDAGHFNENGFKAVGNMLFELLCANGYLDTHAKKEENGKEKRINEAHIIPESLTFWLNDIKSLRNPIGSIVMNCNPFTLGHRYLIEYAAKHSLHLYIFVVEEDRSVFPFADRFELVKQGAADLPNVTVLPSGQFIISQLTFTDYFGKSELQDKTIDPTFDVELFAEHIAPTLGITVRFAGEEPLDKVTLQYNQAMARILPKHGINFEVIPRKESDGAVISASRVRALLKVGNFDEIKKIVPETTYSYLVEKYGSALGGGYTS